MPKGKASIRKAVTKMTAVCGLTGMTMADIEGSGEPVGKHTVSIMISKAVSDAVDQFSLDQKNVEADKLDFETKLRKGMQELVTPLVE